MRSRPEAGRKVPADSAIVTGASRGFTVLLLGGVVQPAVGAVVPWLGFVWLVLVAVAAFGWSAWIASSSPGAEVRHAISAAVGGYALVLPVVIMASGPVDLLQITLTSLTACVTAAAVYAARRAGQVPAGVAR